VPNPAKSAFAWIMVALILSPSVAWSRSEPEPNRSRLLEPGGPWKLAPPGQLRQAALIDVSKPRPQPPLMLPSAVPAHRQASPGIEWMFAIEVPSAPVIVPALPWSMGGPRGVARTFADGLDLGASLQPDGQLAAPSLVGLMLAFSP
jgi:hypothetical protein